VIYIKWRTRGDPRNINNKHIVYPLISQ